MEEKDNLSSNLYKKRNPIIAFIFSLIQPGLGQFYNGQITKSIILISLIIIGKLTYYILGIITTFKGFLVIVIIDLLFIIFNAIDAAIVAITSKNYKIKSFNKWYWYLLIIVSLNLLYMTSKNFRHSYYENFRITSSSMENTLLIGDIVVCDKRYYHKHNIQRNDILAFESSQSDKPVAFRVVGLPNDKIEIIDKILYVNDIKSSQESFKFIDSRIIPRYQGRLNWDEEFIGSKDNFGPIIVPENQYFVLGDNFDISADSRYYGCVKRNEVIGKPLYIYFSYGKSPINDFTEYANLRRNRKNEFRKSRVGKRIE